MDGPERITVNTPIADDEPLGSADEVEFMMAVDAYKRLRRRPFPTWREVLAVARSLGYRKVAEPGPLPVPRRPSANDGGPLSRGGSAR